MENFGLMNHTNNKKKRKENKGTKKYTTHNNTNVQAHKKILHTDLCRLYAQKNHFN